MNYLKIYNFLKLLLIISLVVGFGMFAINESLEYFYKTEFLLTSCELCQKQMNLTELNGFIVEVVD